MGQRHGQPEREHNPSPVGVGGEPEGASEDPELAGSPSKKLRLAEPAEDEFDVGGGPEGASEDPEPAKRLRLAEPAEDEFDAGSCMSWSAGEVTRWLTSLQLTHLHLRFDGIDGATILELSDADLREIGVEKMLERRKLSGHIQRLKLAALAAASSATASSVPCPAKEEAPLPLEDGSANLPALMADSPASKNFSALSPLQEGVAVTTVADTTLPVALEDASIGLLQRGWEDAEALRKELEQGVQALLLGMQQASSKVATFGSSRQAASLAQQVAADLEQLSASIQRPPELRVPFFGVTGAGKSTTINALLCESVVPTSGWRACTSVPVELRFGRSMKGSGLYDATVHLKSEATWVLERRQLLTDLLMSDRQRVSRREPPRGSTSSPAEVAYDTLRVVYPEAFMLESKRPWPNLDAAEKELQGIKNKVTCRHAESQDLFFWGERAGLVAQQLLDFVDNPEAENEAAFWPLVERVMLVGPFPGAHPSIVPIDAPGVQDSNGARSAVVGRLLKEAGGIVIAANIKRAASDRVARDMLGERFRRQLLMDGHYSGALAFVATATDDICVSELRQNLGEDAASMGQQELALLRNSCAKNKIRKDCFAGLRRIYEQSDLPPRTDAELQEDGVAPTVFTTSARDYQRLRGLLDASVDGPAHVWQQLEDTEIPQLRCWLHQLGQNALFGAQDAWEQKLKQICKCLSQSSSDAAGASQVRCLIQEAMNTADSTLAARLEDKLAEAQDFLRQSLEPEVQRGQQQAAEEAKSTMGSRCRPKGQGGMHHGTFKASARRLGEWHEDWNALMADPLNRAIAVRWNAALNKRMPQLVDELVSSLQSELCTVQCRFELPLDPFDEACACLRNHAECLKERVRSKQMEVSRQVKENVKERMSSCYSRAAAQNGAGMDVRQKEIVHQHVSNNGRSLFKSVGGLLQDELADLLKDLRELTISSVKSAMLILRRALERHSANEGEQATLRAFRAACAAVVAEASAAAERRAVTRASLVKQTERLCRPHIKEIGCGEEDAEGEAENNPDKEGEEQEQEDEEDEEDAEVEDEDMQQEASEVTCADNLEDDLARLMSQAGA
eukprot:TRINITY_DN77411_c0_g1_i1.p1 TRINITY_DN77411_c0_g1~~TRINITY_DN77411_c0_g1_i1.p1  ORF type:complete len:1078 (+),score=263.86 TRINITY_DN77411_c0_g1_i1:66-3299(+)